MCPRQLANGLLRLEQLDAVAVVDEGHHGCQLPPQFGDRVTCHHRRRSRVPGRAEVLQSRLGELFPDVLRGILHSFPLADLAVKHPRWEGELPCA